MNSHGVQYCRRIIGELTPNQYTELRDMMNEISEYGGDPDGLLIYATDQAHGHAARNWAYLKAVLNTLISRGTKTQEEAVAADAPQAAKAKRSDVARASPKPVYNPFLDMLREEGVVE